MRQWGLSLAAAACAALGACDGPREQAGERIDAASGLGGNADIGRGGPAERLGEKQDRAAESFKEARDAQADALERAADAQREAADQQAKALEERARELRGR